MCLTVAHVWQVYVTHLKLQSSNENPSFTIGWKNTTTHPNTMKEKLISESRLLYSVNRTWYLACSPYTTSRESHMSCRAIVIAWSRCTWNCHPMTSRTGCKRTTASGGFTTATFQKKPAVTCIQMIFFMGLRGHLELHMMNCKGLVCKG